MMQSNDGTDKPLTLAEHLQKLAPSKIIPQRLSIKRDTLFQDSVSFFKKSSFDFDSPIKILYENEPAIDGGGPRREYFTLLLKCLVSPGNFVRLFEGSERHLLPMHNTDALRASLYKVAGRMIATSILNGCPGFLCLSPAVYSYLISGSCQEIDIVKEDIADIDIRDIVTQVSDASMTICTNFCRKYSIYLFFLCTYRLIPWMTLKIFLTKSLHLLKLDLLRN